MSQKRVLVSQMIISGVEIEVIKKDIKNMHLTVLSPNGSVRITAPKNMSDEVIKRFASKKIGWVKKKIEKFQNQPRQSERKYVSGESHYLWGRKYLLDIQHTTKANNIAIKSNKLVLTVRKNSTPQRREKLLNEWYRAEIKAKLPGLFKKWENVIGVKANAIGVKNMRTRWGSCNTKDKRVWINLQLAKKPVACLEYIIVHELVHLLERNHTPVFYGHMDKFLPDWRLTKDELNNFIR